MNFDAFLKAYTQRGLIKKQTCDYKVIEQTIARAQKEITIAEATSEIDEGVAFTVAYTAMLHAGRALMLIKGYRPADGAQHKTVVEFTGMCLGKKFKTLALHFEKMRKKRNIFTYEVTISISPSEVTAAITAASNLVQAISVFIKEENPQHHFSF